MMIKESPVRDVTVIKDMKVSITEEADKRLADMSQQHDDEVLERAKDSGEVETLKKENLQLMTIVGQISGQINTLTSSFAKFSTNVEAQLVLMNNRIKAAENNLAYIGERSPDRERAYYEINNIRRSLERIKSDSPLKEISDRSPFKENIQPYVPTNTFNAYSPLKAPDTNKQDYLDTNDFIKKMESTIQETKSYLKNSNSRY